MHSSFLLPTVPGLQIIDSGPCISASRACLRAFGGILALLLVFQTAVAHLLGSEIAKLFLDPNGLVVRRLTASDSVLFSAVIHWHV